MTRNIVWFITVVAAALLQTTWPDYLKIQGVQPGLSLLLVVYFAIVDGEERAMFTGVIGGIYQDVASTAVLGHHVLCLVVTGFVIGRFSTRLITEHPAIKAGLVFLAGMGHGLLFRLILYVQDPANGVVNALLSVVVPGVFYTAVITPVAFLLLSGIFGRRESLQGGLP